MGYKHYLSASIIVFICVCLALAGCQPAVSSTQIEATESPISPTIAPDMVSLVILHTNDVLGNIDPCG